MAFIDDKKKEINCKVVFFGPPLCGKSTTLRHIHTTLNKNEKEHPITLTQGNDRTLYFDFIPVSIGNLRDYAVRLHLYTVPGQKVYEQSRRLIAKGVDGIVFIADSELAMMEQNIESLVGLQRICGDEGIDWHALPRVFQYNKRDLALAVPVVELTTLLNRNNCPEFETVATKGTGVMDAFAAISEKVLLGLKSST
jgi:mutual gliding-motility protein MglA